MPPLIFPQPSTAAALQFIVDRTLTLRLYSNNHYPSVLDTIADFVEVVGGGYAAVPLTTPNWAVTPGTPSVALYSAFIDFGFTAAPVPATIYGYILTDPDDLVVLVEQLFATGAPFVPTTGSRLQIRPRFGADNLVAAPFPE